MADQFTAKALRSVLILHGPNLSLLGTRESEIYGTTTLADINAALAEHTVTRGVTLAHFQPNHESALVDRVHAAKSEGIEFIIINLVAYTHTGVALRDVLAGMVTPYIEVHLPNMHHRELFHHHSYLADQTVGVIYGPGWRGYLTILDFAIDQYNG